MKKIASCLYERLALSRDKAGVKRRVFSPFGALPAEANIRTREYQLYLPSKDLLRRKLLEWTR